MDGSWHSGELIMIVLYWTDRDIYEVDYIQKHGMSDTDIIILIWDSEIEYWLVPGTFSLED